MYRERPNWNQITDAIVKLANRPQFTPGAYEKKVQARAEGLLKTLGLRCLRFSWVITEAGCHGLSITLHPVPNSAELVRRALEAMRMAFRKATATEGAFSFAVDGRPLACPGVCIEFHNKGTGNEQKA